MRIDRRALTGLLIAFGVLLGSTSCTGGTSAHSTLTVLTPWADGDEFHAFEAVIDAFTKENPDITVQVDPTRAAAEVLRSDVQQSDTPDLAVMPNPGTLDVYAEQGDLVRLDRLHDKALSKRLAAELHDDYGPQWYSLEEAGRSAPYAVVVKADVKSLIWYDPRHIGHVPPPASWQQLAALAGHVTSRGTEPWCLAVSDPPNSGYPGTDWIEDILLHQSGPSVYREWADGKLAWTSSDVTKAWQTWGQVVAAGGQGHEGALTALLTDQSQGDYPLFAAPPGCSLYHGALVTLPAGVTPKPTVGSDYDFVPFPAGGRGRQEYEVSGDLMGMFHDSPQAEKLMAFLASADGQRVWPTKFPDQAFSPDLRVAGSLEPVYAKDAVAGRVYQILTSKNVTLCFDASDLMPDTMTNAFYRAVLEYLQDPGQLPSILKQLDKVRLAAQAAGTSHGTTCGPTP